MYTNEINFLMSLLNNLNKEQLKKNRGEKRIKRITELIKQNIIMINIEIYIYIFVLDENKIQLKKES